MQDVVTGTDIKGCWEILCHKQTIGASTSTFNLSYLEVQFIAVCPVLTTCAHNSQYAPPCTKTGTVQVGSEEHKSQHGIITGLVPPATRALYPAADKM